MGKNSWKKLDDKRVVKHVDFSCFEHGVTIIPVGYRPFFGLPKDKASDKKDIPLVLIHKSKKFNTTINWSQANEIATTRILLAKGGFLKELKKYFPDWEQIQANENNLNRRLIFKKTSEQNVFDIELLNETLEEAKERFEKAVEKIIKSPIKEKPKGSKKPARTERISVHIKTDEKVAGWVLEKSEGICECCGEKAPFSTPDRKYLEIHHVKRLKDGGSDTTENTVAICPNCHRELHYGENKDRLTDSLYEKIKRLKRE